jgi:hypothetical protein
MYSMEQGQQVPTSREAIDVSPGEDLDHGARTLA